MALVDRLTQHEEPWIPGHQFFAAINEVLFNGVTINGNVINGATATEVRTYFGIAANDPDWLALVALFPSGTTTAALIARLVLAERIHGVIMLAQQRVPGYDTPANVRSKLGI